jgi:hypothetical protein
MAQGGGFLTDGDAPTTKLQITVGTQVKTGEEKKNNLHPGKSSSSRAKPF